MRNLMEDWLVVFVALLDHFSPANKQFVLDAYLNYFLSLAEIEEQASLYAGVPVYQNMTYTDMKVNAQTAANKMFYSVRQHVDLPPRFPTPAEIENARIFGDMMSRWSVASNSMPTSVYDDHELARPPAISLTPIFLPIFLAILLPVLLARYALIAPNHHLCSLFRSEAILH
ncbi:hypothetical protein B0H13DRAFT_2362538 [Mycena leptocephala]|nr:hypothetical protein B0H13DRAFT_2362538 [Mycena leptocephala]